MTRVLFHVFITDDEMHEGKESFILAIQSPVVRSIAPSRSKITIKDNDGKHTNFEHTII